MSFFCFFYLAENVCTCTDTQGAAVPPYTATATTTEGTDTRGYVNEAFWLGGGVRMPDTGA